METIVRECNYPNTDSTGDAERFDADYAESVTIRRYLIASGDVVLMVRKMRSNLRASLPKIFDPDLAHRYAPEPGMLQLCLYCGRAKTWPYHT